MWTIFLLTGTRKYSDLKLMFSIKIFLILDSAFHESFSVNIFKKIYYKFLKIIFTQYGSKHRNTFPVGFDFLVCE